MKLAIVAILFIGFSCAKKTTTTDTSSTSMTSTVVTNLNTISASYSPTSLASSSSNAINPLDNPCANTTDFAVCQSNLIREYLRIGKTMVDLLSTLGTTVGTALGNLADGASGISSDGKIIYKRVSATEYGIISRGTGGASEAYFAVKDNKYTLTMDSSVDLTTPKNNQATVTVTFTDANTWVVDVFYSTSDCDSSNPGAPSKAEVIVSKANGLWSGKAMLYIPRWSGVSNVTCSTQAGTSDLVIYTDFVGNNTSTKAALYVIPSATTSLSSISNYDFKNFCSNFSSYCGGSGQPTSTYMANYPNNWCTTGPNTTPTWGDNCTSNTAVAAASFLDSSYWVAPSTLKAQTVTVPVNIP